MPAQLDARAQSPALCRRSEGWVLFWFVFPPPFFISPVLFVSLALWVGIAATCWLSDSWADCPLTVPSPEQKGRRGLSVCPQLLLLCLWKTLGPSQPLLPPVGRQELKLSSRTALPSVAAEREWTSPLAKACLGLLPLLLPAYSASSPVVFLEGPFTATSVGVKAQEGGEPWW